MFVAISIELEKMVYDNILGEIRKEKITEHDTDEVLDFLQNQAFKGESTSVLNFFRFRSLYKLMLRTFSKYFFVAN